MVYGEGLSKLSPCKNAFIADILSHYAPDFSLLCDIGCGRGERLGYLSCVFPDANCFGIDIDSNNLAQAARNAPAAHFIVADACQTGFSSQYFDVLLCECTFSLLDDPDTFFKETRRILKVGGILILGDLMARKYPENRFSLAQNKVVKNIYGKTWLEKSAGFPLLSFTDCSHDLSNMMAQMIMDGTLCNCFDCSEMKEMKSVGIGYGLWVFCNE